MKLEYLRAAAAVARAGSFRRAALAERQSQATLTRAVAALERDLGLTLFRRTSRGVALTQAGSRILARGEIVLADVERVMSEARLIRGEEPGSVRLAVSPYAGMELLPRALHAFRRSYPTGTVEVGDGFYPDCIPALRDGLIDLAVVAQPKGARDAGIRVEVLTEIRVLVATSRGNPLAAATQLADLAGAPWVTHGPFGGPSGLFDAGIGGQSLPTSLTRSHCLMTLLAVIAETGAMCLLSDVLLERLKRTHALVEVPIAAPLPVYDLALLRRMAQDHAPSIDLFADLLRRRSLLSRA